ncbi:MAG TPA: protein kinase [Phycisphaerae bacterium]|nr:protein kinase [Phycisphaerae bacterium]
MSSPPEHPGNKTAAGSDTYVGRAVVDARLATPEEVQACISKLAQYHAAGKNVTLADLLVKAGFVTPSQLKRLAHPADDSMAPAMIQIPGFQLMRKVGAGAMASVYMAKQLSLDRIVAIKILPKRLSDDPEFVARFYKEGRAAAKLNHNNIVQAIDVGEYGSHHYFVMEYVDGKTVYDEMAKKRVYSEREALDIIIQIAKALEHAHAKGFLHRDVKPKNIMITKDGTAKLADMGLARQASDAEAATAEKGRAFGTPYYISPEQIRGAVDVDFRVDIYSLGATLYHMVTGRVPFEGNTPAEIMHKHLREPLVPPDHLNPSLSAGLGEVVERAMAKDPDRRYQSTSDLLLDLEAVRRGEAPPQAHMDYDANLLKNLADGTGPATGPALQAGQAQDLPSGTKANYGAAMLAVLIVESILIVILLAVLAARG